MKKNCNLLTILLLSVASLATAQSYDGSPYTAWMNDYTGNEPHTLLLWKFDNTGTVETPVYSYDSSGNGYTAGFSATATETGVPGKFGTAFFTGPGRQTTNVGYVRNTSSSSAFNGSALSVEFWYRPEIDGILESGSLGYFFDRKYADATGGIRLEFQNNNDKRLTVVVGNSEGNFSLNTSGLEWLASEWYHIAVTYENIDGDGRLRIYRNGELLAEAIREDFGDLYESERWWNIGNRLGSSFGNVPGYFDNFRISDVAYNYSTIPEPSSAFLLIAVPFLFLAYRKCRAKNL